ncbi:hypothetical protein CLAFUW4_08826 [Fulvia fulva]|uniref:Uncharacterized protein n=1 Tax=Passalora fulva TaxID=5499 RepID=A0A9Q8PGN4_PASFU|nr:uncharacterized protein CLAFUR5_08932 [Fulvia fulva]KAK4614018.1 hypothetical protein CLAFUR4_08832 [Fulvia fulva]KAK4614913.1 hypothetical protein CLAFUR0_08824 [Fulvia fulva]UJO22072.1 hypothetical protein CLAFUR5_08932 [Fulvia fulva]WPV19866.1 hypothetical protein CLAFUW4_08826 [Fulvia fulva]WPV35088.1 hypothetical protein CLAFUW7_08827 [Fulvia fulva]
MRSLCRLKLGEPAGRVTTTDADLEDGELIIVEDPPTQKPPKTGGKRKYDAGRGDDSATSAPDRQPAPSKKRKTADAQTKKPKPASPKYTKAETTPHARGEKRPGGCPDEIQVMEAYRSSLAASGRGWDPIKNDQMKALLLHYHGITFSANRVNRAPLLAILEPLCKDHCQKQDEADRERRRRNDELKEAARRKDPNYVSRDMVNSLKSAKKR